MRSLPFFAGIDGEGKDDPPIGDALRGYHRYVLLAWSDNAGKRLSYVEDDRGLATGTCLEFLFEEVPDHARLFAYAMGYDLTMMLKDLSDRQLYRLFRPELRKRLPAPDGTPRPPHPVPFRADGWTYKLNYMGSKFSVARGNKTRVIWDVFKFFQSKFTGAITDWKVGTEKEVDAIQKMKDQRGEFSKLHIDDVTRYCFDECRLLAQLTEKLTVAHERAGLELKAYHGAGSTTTAMFNVMGVGDKIRPALPEMIESVACGFFGGRFEHSLVGAAQGPIWSYDISSAYPYEMTDLPCLLHAHWSLTKSEKRMREARHALVHYTLGKFPKDVSRAWGPFPFRETTGAIVYPLESGGGWVWRDEFLSGEWAFDHVQFQEAWILESDCDCGSPFAQIPRFYAERILIGKEGPGIVLKGGMNGGYGKCAQSVGDAPFQSWVWAGMITSGTRAQILRTLAVHGDRSNLLAVATDGIYSREELLLEEPRDTGTRKLRGPDGEYVNKPLGGWERKVISPPKNAVGTVFFARPGVYWPMDPTVEVKLVRARGIGRAVLYKNREMIQDAFFHDQAWTTLPDVVRFRGAKTAISADREAVKTGGRKGIVTRSPAYGQWETRPTIMNFDPRPKREGRYQRRGTFAKVDCRLLPGDLQSAPYRKAVVSEEARLLQSLAEELKEQPDLDFLGDDDEWKNT